MKFTEFKKGLDQKNEYSIYLFEGEDAYFRLRGIALIKAALVSEPNLNFASFEGDAPVKEILTSLDSYPFMSDKRVTLVTEFYPDKTALNALKGYLENPPTDSVLVIANEKKCEALKKFESVNVVDCNKQSADILVKWVNAECNRNGVAIENKAAQMIVEFCLSDMSRIENETLKLIFYVGNGGTVTPDDVIQNVWRDAEYKIYEMTEYIGKKKFDLAFTVVNDMLSKGEPIQKLLFSIYSYFRRLLHVAISDKSNAQLAEILGIKEFAVKKTVEQAKMFKKRSLKQAVDRLVQADYDVKRGAIDQSEAFWLSIFKIMTE